MIQYEDKGLGAQGPAGCSLEPVTTGEVTKMKPQKMNPYGRRRPLVRTPPAQRACCLAGRRTYITMWNANR